MEAAGEPQDSFCELIVIRHGETDWNKTRRIQGVLDIPLNDTGREQLRQTGQNIRSLIESTPGVLPFNDSPSLPGNNSIGAHKMYTSPLCRASESASILAESVGYPVGEIEELESVKEWNAGEVQGVLFPEVPEKCPSAWEAWRVSRDPHYEFNGGESFHQRHERIKSAIQALAERHLGQRIVVVCHSGVIDEIFRVAKSVPLQNPTKIPKLNGGVYILHASSTRLTDTTSSTRPTDTTSCTLPTVFKPKWKILRWGLQKVPHRKASIQFDLTSNLVGYDPFSTEYA